MKTQTFTVTKQHLPLPAPGCDDPSRYKGLDEPAKKACESAARLLWEEAYRMGYSRGFRDGLEAESKA